MKINTNKRFDKLCDILDEIRDETGYQIAFSDVEIEIDGETIIFTCPKKDGKKH